jgi:predicted dehydrogenase
MKITGKKYMTENFTRRNFLQTTIAAAPLLLSTKSGAASRVVPPSDRINIGHIGVGGQGTGLLSNFLQIDDSQSVAVCDCFESRRMERALQIDQHYSTKFSQPYQATRQYADFRELLACADIDCVIIATPDHWHVPIALAAIKAGKDVYVEKPLGISVQENLALRRAVQQTGAVFQYGTQQRSNHGFWFACELVRNGYIGALHTIHAWCADIHSQEGAFAAPNGSMQPIPLPPGFDYDRWIGPAPMTPYTADRCSSYGSWHHYDNALGFIAGWGAHPLDIAQWGNNSDETAPVEYEGSGIIPRGGMFETICDWDMWCLYENGVKMRFMSEGVARSIVPQYHYAFHDHGTTFFGSEGWISVDRQGVYASSKSLLSIKITPEKTQLYKSRNHYKNFVDCVRTRKQTICPIENAVQSDLISHLCDISIRVGRKIRWDTAKEQIVNDPIAARMLSRSRRSPWNF